MNTIIDTLLSSTEPSIRYKVRVNVLGERPDSASIRKLRAEIKQSSRVRSLLKNRDDIGRIKPASWPYKKWYGAHWVFASLADIGYPPGELELTPIRDQVFDCWLNPEAVEEHIYTETIPMRQYRGVPIICGRPRRHASQEGNALYAAVTLGLMDERCQQLADGLMRWQWPDGGWNCDPRPSAAISSFWESLIPLRALTAYAQATGSTQANDASKRAAEVFLERRLFRRRRDGEIMNPQFVRLHYPCYWRYDILFGLKVMAETGYIHDKRCHEALELLQSKELPGGGWPAEERFYRTARKPVSNGDLVSWGGISTRKLNEWVTADALYVLSAAGLRS